MNRTIFRSCDRYTAFFCLTLLAGCVADAGHDDGSRGERTPTDSTTNDGKAGADADDGSSFAPVHDLDIEPQSDDLTAFDPALGQETTPEQPPASMDPTGQEGPATQASHDDFYVSLKGNDQDPGTLSRPFRTLERAQSAVQKRLSEHAGHTINVWLRAGRYEISTTLALGSKDSGSATAPVIWRAYTGERANLIGGKLLDPAWFKAIDSNSPAWSRLDASVRSHVVAVDLGAHGIHDYGTLSYRGFGVPGKNAALELFVDSVPQQLARFPDASTSDPQKGFLTIAEKLSDLSIRYDSDRPAHWQDTGDLWFHGLWGNTWADEHKHATLDASAKTLSFSEAPKYAFKAKQPFYAYNILEEITLPGEWYVDRKTGVLYLYPKASLAGKAIVVSTLEAPIVALDGASHVQFRDLVIEDGRADLVQIKGGSDVQLSHLLLRNAGRRAAEISGTKHVVDGCEINNTGERGIHLSGGDRVSLTRGDNLIQGSTFFKFGRWVWMYEPGLFVGGVGNVVRKNLIHHSPHAGILWGGNDQLIELNELHHVCQSASDAGAIYSGRDWGARGVVIQHNFLHDISTWLGGLGVHGVYLDDTLAGPRVEGNVFYKVQGAAIMHGGGRDLKLVNNIIARCGMALKTDARGPRIFDKITVLEKLIAVHYQDEPWRSRYPDCAAIPNSKEKVKMGKWLYPQGVVFARNLAFANTTFKKVTDNATSYFYKIENNLENQDPHFTDEASLDLSLKPDSPALSIPGFQAIPFADIGP